MAYGKVDGVEPCRQTVGIPQSGHRKVVAPDWHELCPARDKPQLRCVAILMSVGGYSLINLPNRQLIPVQVLVHECCEHGRGSQASADSQ
jgi:hypothetical protein